MVIVLYEKPLRMELSGHDLLVDGRPQPKTVRTLSEMVRVFMSHVEMEGLEDLAMYYMYRQVYKRETTRFDITVIPARQIGGECAKTYGHYHPRSEDGLAYPEIYQVLHGSCTFLLQKKNRNGSVDVSIIGAKEKDVVLMPPFYGHVSINSGKDDLVLSNLVYDRFESMYREYETNRGAAYYYLKDGSLVQNSNYLVEKSERLGPAELNARYGFQCQDLFTEFYSKPEKFAFLEKPSLLGKSQ